MKTGVRDQAREAVTKWVVHDLAATVRQMRVTRSAYSSSATILNVHLELEGGQRVRVVYKDATAPSGPKPEFIADGGREARMYRTLLASDGIAGAPRLLSSGRGPNGGHWLLMEWAGSVDLGQVGSRAVWSQAAAQLARLHAWGESHLDAVLGGSPVRWDDPNLHLLFARRARRRGDGLAALWRRYDTVAERLAAMPKTVVHGDLNASNVLVHRDGVGTRVRMIDWETAGVGPGLFDLASLTSGTLPERHREEMVEAYRRNRATSRLGALPPSDFDDALRWCRLALAVRWLGWAPGWSPPAAHAHDWRSEALALGRQLGLLGPR